MISVEASAQRDGSLWQYYRLSEQGSAVVVTSAGRRALTAHPETRHLLHQYRMICEGRAKKTLPDVRKWFKSGANSDVYYLGGESDMVVKELSTSQSSYFALHRMDRLKSIIEDSVPRWIDIPDHYALLTSPKLKADYMLIKKVDAGITVADVTEHPLEEVQSDPVIVDGIGLLNAQDQLEISDRFALAKLLLDEALVSEGLEPKSFLPDWQPGNVLVERVPTPIAGSRFMLWVIDQ